MTCPGLWGRSGEQRPSVQCSVIRPLFYGEEGVVPEFISVVSLVCGSPSSPELWECWPSLLSPLPLPESPGEGQGRGTCDMALGDAPSEQNPALEAFYCSGQNLTQ